MSGFTDLSAQSGLNFVTGAAPMPALGNRFLGLFTTAPTTDASTSSGTEVTGGAYARIQVAGAVAATASFTTGGAAVTMAANPGWVVPNMNVYDATNGFQIGTVLTYVGTALVLTGNAAHASSGSTDSLIFSAWPIASGSAPSSALNGAPITFPAATASWGTVVAFGLYDAAGNLLDWDYLGPYSWLPVTIASGAAAAITAKAHGFANGDSVVYSTEYGGTQPTSGLTAGGTLQTVAGAATDSFNVGATTGSTGSGMVRKVTQQSIPSGVTASFAAGTITLTSA